MLEIQLMPYKRVFKGYALPLKILVNFIATNTAVVSFAHCSQAARMHSTLNKIAVLYCTIAQIKKGPEYSLGAALPCKEEELLFLPLYHRTMDTLSSKQLGADSSMWWWLYFFPHNVVN